MTESVVLDSMIYALECERRGEEWMVGEEGCGGLVLSWRGVVCEDVWEGERRFE